MYLVRAADLTADEQAVRSLLASGLACDGERYEWLYRRLVALHNSCWLLTEAGGGVVGCATLMPRDVWHLGTPVRGAQAVDFVVERPHRTAGPALQLARGVLSGAAGLGLDLLYGLPSRVAEGTLLRVGYQRLGAVTYWVRPLSYRRLVAAWFPNGRLLRLPAMAGAAILDGARAWAARLAAPTRRANASLFELTGFDERFDDLWHRARTQFPIAGDRGSQYLAWRFAPRSGREYRIFCAADASGVLTGYVIWYPRADAVRIADVLADARARWRPLLAAFLRLEAMRDFASVGLLHFGAPWLDRHLRALGFSRRRHDTSVVFCPLSPRVGDPQCSAAAAWHLTEADKDA